MLLYISFVKNGIYQVEQHANSCIFTANSCQYSPISVIYERFEKIIHVPFSSPKKGLNFFKSEISLGYDSSLVKLICFHFYPIFGFSVIHMARLLHVI